MSPDPAASLLAKEFPLAEELIYLNHAAVSPWPRRTAEAVVAFAHENVLHGARRYPDWVATEARVRRQCAALINASDEDIAFSKNTSEALSIVAWGLPWHEGDNVVIPHGEFPSNRVVWESLRSRGVTVREVELGNIRDPEAQLVAAFDTRTRLLSVSSVQYATGLRLDLTRLGEACRKQGAAFCVDAIQGLGALPHDVAAMHIDFLAADAHKWLLGPEGIALFYCSPRWREQLQLHEYGWHMLANPNDFSRTDWEPATSGRRFEPGSPNMLGIHALSASLSLILETGIDVVERRLLERAELLFDRLAADLAVSILTPVAKGRYAGIVTFRHTQRDTDKLFSELTSRNIVCAARGGGIRFSPHFYTPLAKLEQAIDILGQVSRTTA